ncbi:MAG: DUF433 domain-containing protein [Armatimonadetes bacterium]|nr:DUF433 domain-containing protein [Anaerolineae bacterium]
MLTLPDTVTLPMKLDDYGNVRIGGTRVTLDSIMACYQQGDTPETIHTSFDSVTLADIYAVISYYLTHQAEVNAYLKVNDEIGERIRQEIEANYTPEQQTRTEYFRSLVAQKAAQPADA